MLSVISNLSAIPAIWIEREKRSVLWFYMLFSFLIDTYAFVLVQLEKELHWLSNIFILIEFFLVTVYFIRNVFPERWAGTLYICVTIISACFIINTYRLSIWKTNLHDAALFHALYIIYCLYGLYKVISEIKFVMIESNPLFIFCTAILLYASGNFVYFLFDSELVKIYKDEVTELWKIWHNPLNTLKNALIGYGLWISRKSK